MRYSITIFHYTVGGTLVEVEKLSNFKTPQTAIRRAFQLRTKAWKRGLHLKWAPPQPEGCTLAPVLYDGPPIRKGVEYHGNYTCCPCCGVITDGTPCKGCF